jgi:peptide/nickel transport system ATP-binding protein
MNQARDDAGLVAAGLDVAFNTPSGPLEALRDVEFAIAPGTILGLVGESGSGKSTLAYAILQYLPQAKITARELALGGRDLRALSAAALREIRGRAIGIVYQDPSTALNPTLPLGEQLAESVQRAGNFSGDALLEEQRALLTRVGLPDPDFIMKRFPHEVSGGEKQRVLIAMAIAARPRLLIFDEPTTALDATTAAGILDLVRDLARGSGAAVLFISHDLGTISRIADRVAVIYAGRIVERGPVEQVLRRPLHPYTRMLIASAPNPFAPSPTRRLVTYAAGAEDPRKSRGCAFAARCPFAEPACREAVPALIGESGAACRRLDAIAGAVLPADRGAEATSRAEGSHELLRVEDLTVEYGRRSLLQQLTGDPGDKVSAVDGVSFAVADGETVGLVGESGCGKSTLARALVGLTPFRGRIALAGEHVDATTRPSSAYRRAAQIVFQQPDSSLNPRHSVGASISRPLKLYRGLSGAGLDRAVGDWLERVRLPREYAKRHPHALSGGEKQRVAIARAFAAEPRLVICDEITSSLDVSVQAAILNLLLDLQAEHGTAFLFISHDLNLIRQIADRILVMYLGRVVEERRVIAGDVAPPMHPYAEALLAAVPVPDPTIAARRVRLEGPLPSPKNPPPGCRFATRCPRRIGDVCDTPPPQRVTPDGGHIACHHDLATLAATPPLWRRA